MINQIFLYSFRVDFNLGKLGYFFMVVLVAQPHQNSDTVLALQVLLFLEKIAIFV